MRFSQAWQLARRRSSSDQQATQIAIEQTEDELTVLLAEQKVAEWIMNLKGGR